jgi:basic amino acid/polyamine antiporter, APA family
MGTLLAFAIVCLCVLVLRKTQPHIERPFRTPWVPVVPILGILISFALMLSLGIFNWIRLIAWLAIGLFVYFLFGKNNSHLGKKEQIDQK